VRIVYSGGNTFIAIDAQVIPGNSGPGGTTDATIQLDGIVNLGAGDFVL
jgi:hypothetical protein